MIKVIKLALMFVGLLYLSIHANGVPTPKVRLAEPDPDFFNFIPSYSPEDSSVPIDPSQFLQNPLLYGGDILLRRRPNESAVSDNPDTSAPLYNGGNAGGHWLTLEVADYDGTTKNMHCIPFAIHDSISYTNRQKILQAMRTKFLQTCVRWVHYDPSIPGQEAGRVTIFPGQGCYANVGKMGGEQVISLAQPHCMYDGIITHELMHAMGFWHEHQRPDRDEHIKIYPQNIDHSMMNQFAKASYPGQISHLFDWDNEGIMLYGSRSFQKTRSPSSEHWSMSTLDGNVLREVHEKYGLTQNDIKAVNKYYGCCDKGFEC